MKKYLIFVLAIFILGAVFFAWKNVAAETFLPAINCTQNEIDQGNCPNTPNAGKKYIFEKSNDYCRADGIQTAFTALSNIEYKKPYSELEPDQQNKINYLLASDTKERSSIGLVPCGRSCDDPTTSVNEAEDCSFCHFFSLFNNIINWILKFVVSSLAVIFVVIGGFLLATSRGNPGQLQKGKDILIWTFAGIAVIFVGWMVLNSLLSGMGVVKWTGLRGETGEFENYYIDGRLYDSDRSGDKAWEENDWNGFVIELSHPSWPEPILRRIADTGSNTIFIDDPLPSNLPTYTKLEYKIGGWWQFACGLD